MNASSPVLFFKNDYPLEDYGQEDRLAACMEAEPDEFPCTRGTILGCFITREGYIEPALARPAALVHEDFEWPQISSAGILGLSTFSENESRVQLHRCLGETGQLVVRTTDYLTDVWFAGVGDPENLFIEFFARGDLEDADESIRCWLCPLPHAEGLLGRLHQGASGQELWALMPALAPVPAIPGPPALGPVSPVSSSRPG